MSETAVKTKKKWSKKKKAIVIVLCVFVFLILVALIGGLVALNSYCQTKDYTVVAADTTKNVQIVAHRGFRAVAPENTLPAFEEAGKAGFWGAECDTYRTKDGVWVITHDPYTYRMMDKNSNIEKKTYEELMTYTYDNGVNISNYKDLKICTLQQYLDTCKKYGMRAVIELKGKNNTEHYDEIMSLVDKSGADVMFISFNIENLQKMRALTADLPVWFLVQKIDDESIEQAKSLGGVCGIDFNCANEENDSVMVGKCLKQDLQVGAWTVDTKEDMNRLVDIGVQYITTDNITY